MLILQTRQQRELGNLITRSRDSSGVESVQQRAVLVDAVLDDELLYSRTITTHPIETGQRVADHSYINPVRWGIRGAVSDIPLTWDTTSYGESDGTTRASSAFQLIRQLFESDEPFDVQHGLVLLRNMMIESISFPRDVSTGKALFFFASLTEVILVETEEIVTDRTRVLGAQAQAQATTPIERRVEVEEADPEGSFLFRGIEIINGGP